MVARRLLVSDLDGTLLGDEDALARFRAWLAAQRAREAKGWRVVYATGRSLASVRDLVSHGVLPLPDAIVTDVGTRIHDPAGQPWPGWPTWGSDARAAVRRARRLVAMWPGIHAQADEYQSVDKASFEAPGFDTMAVEVIRATLEDHGVAVTVVFSHDRFLDLLPAGAGKAAATRFLASRWDVPLDRVIAAGDSGNDLDLLTGGFCGVVVANAQPEVLGPELRDVYRSNLAFADGVLDGVRHWVDAVA